MKMKMKTVFAAFLAAVSVDAAVIEQVIVRQQWPWSTDVKVEYKLSGVTSPVDISVKAFNGNVELDSSRLAASMTGDRFGIEEDGVGTIIINPVKAFGTAKVALANFKVKLSVTESAENINEVLYKIIDLEPDANGKFSVVDVRRKDFFNGLYGSFETNYSAFGSGGWKTELKDVLVWTGVTNGTLYKTSKIAMRKISAKNYGWWVMGDDSVDSAKPAHNVNLTEDYFLSVFEITQAQLHKLTEKYGANYTDVDNHEIMPAFGRWDMVFGRPNTWPTDLHNVDMNHFFAALRNGTGNSIAFDFPTEAQWEFACRAGTTGRFYTGLADNTDQAKLGYMMNAGNDASAPSPVGSYLPNAFGLYDMYSNASEWCLDYYSAYGSKAVENPIGPETGEKRVTRGAGFTAVYGAKAEATVRRSEVKATAGSNLGCCRLWCPGE